jgi:hypothetical protein
MSEETDGATRDERGRREIPDVDRVTALAKLFDADTPIDPDELGGPMYWPDLSPGEAGREWDLLRAWVDHLVLRFPHLDHHAIPRCWFRHNGHVEVLAALRDQERVNYSESATGTAAVEWHRAFRDIEARLREWTSQLACGAVHETSTRRIGSLDSAEWDQFVNDDVSSRDAQAVDRMLAE